MSWLENKYLGFISIRLDKFKKRDTVYNFRCPLCGDSHKNKNKARGYILATSGFSFHCHNCGAHSSFADFLKIVDSNLHSEYIKESLKEKYSAKRNNPEHAEFIRKLAPPKFVSSSQLKVLQKISKLPVEHPAKKYVMERKIPSHFHYKLFFCPHFKEWVNSMVPGKFETIDKDEARLVIPFIDEKKKMFGFQGRTFSKFGLRYITIMLEEKPKIFGLDNLDKDGNIFVFEGPIDSMFVVNSIAVAGGHLISNLNKMNLPKEKFVICYDNEPRSIHTVKKIDKAIDAGYNVCLWNDSIFDGLKDVNEMILKSNKIGTGNIRELILKHSYSGLKAKLNLNYWRKV